jgi:hypothetical protein
MQHRRFLISALVVTLAALGLVAYASRERAPESAELLARQAPAAAPAQAADKPVIDPAAMGALDRMGVYLRTLKSFRVLADVTRDDVLDDGQMITFASKVDFLVAPNRLRADLTSDRKDRLFLYDGKTFTLFARRMNYYSSIAAPATTGELVDLLDEKYDIELPLTDMFFWGTPRARTSTADITAAGDYGPSVVEDTTCQHYAFRQEGLDWQIWIQNGEHALPRKVVLTTLTDDARPQYSAVYTWQLAPSFNEAAFTFTPPADAKPIVFATR